MKKLITILLILISFSSFAQNYKGYNIEALFRLEAKDAFVISNDTMYNTTQLSDIDTTFVTKLWAIDSLVALTMPLDSILYSLQGRLVHQEGKTFYDSIKHAFSYYNDIADVTVNIGLENLIRIYNNTLDTIYNGTVVAPSGDQFGSPEILLADSRYKNRSTLVAVATHDIPPITFGWVTKFGEVGGLNTTAYAGFKFLYLNGEGEITTTRPIGGNYETIIGSPGRIDAVDGTIIVDIRTSAITVEQQGYTGWPDADDNSFPDNVGISLDGPTRTLILTATPADEFYHYQDGEKYISTADTFVYSNVEGVHLLYYNEGGITEVVNPTDTESRQVKEIYAGIMNIYHSLTFGTFIFVNNEFHTFNMTGKTKGALYDVHSCTVIDPILLVDFDIDGTGNLDSHAQYGNLSGTIRNEDIKTVVPVTISTAGYSIFYKDGASAWLRATNAGFGVVTAGTGRIAYNEYIAGSWQLTEATNGTYVYYLLLVSNTLGLKYGTIPGHNSYANEQDAVDAGLADAATILQNLPLKEIAKLALVVYQTRDNYNNAVHGRIVSVTDPITGDDVDYIDLAIPGVGAGTGGSGANNFIDLGDVFSTYAGRGDDIVVVNSSEDGLTSLPKGDIPITDFDSTGFRLTQSQVVGLQDSITSHRTDINQNAGDIQTALALTWQDVIDNGTATVTNSIAVGAQIATTATTGFSILKTHNTGGDFYVGIDNSTGTALLTSGGVSYGRVINTNSTKSLILAVNNNKILELDNSLSAIFEGLITSGTDAILDVDVPRWGQVKTYVDGVGSALDLDAVLTNGSTSIQSMSVGILTSKRHVIDETVPFVHTKINGVNHGLIGSDAAIFGVDPDILGLYAYNGNIEFSPNGAKKLILSSTNLNMDGTVTHDDATTAGQSLAKGQMEDASMDIDVNSLEINGVPISAGLWTDSGTDIYSTGDENVRIGNGTTTDKMLTWQVGTSSDANTDFRFVAESTGDFVLQKKQTGAWADYINFNYAGAYLKLPHASSSYINEFSTDGTLGSNSDRAVPTEKAVKIYVDAQVGVNYGTDNQVAYMNGTTALQYTDNFKFDDDDLAISGNIISDEKRIQTGLSTSGSVTMDADNGHKARITLSGDITVTITDLPDGGEGSIEITLHAITDDFILVGGTGYTTEVLMGIESDIDQSTATSHTTVIYWRSGTTLYYGYLWDN